jgi:Ig-like domain from next to BRCA1 gene
LEVALLDGFGSYRRVALCLSAALALAATEGCSAGPPNDAEPTASALAPLTVGGCNCPESGNCAALSFSDVPSNGQYYITTFTGGGMACGGTADGTWAYIADEARFGCGAHILMQANGKQCVAQVADCGPNQCVEAAASNSGCSGHHAIIDASPFITEYLYGISSSGWSEHRVVTATPVSGSVAVGCPGGSVQAPSWGAQYVSQSFPLAANGSINMVTGQTVTESITLKNIGSQSWDGNTKLAPTPRDQPSPFYDSSWLGTTRIVAAGSVAPGQSHQFSFKLHASQTGTFSQYFGMVEEGVHWFSDSGQGGPPDNQLQAKIVVTAPPYAAQVVSTSFPAAGQALVMTPGQTLPVDILLKNVGAKTWDANTKIGTTEPHDRTSPFADSTWPGPNRPAAASGSVAPGATFDFKFDLHAPAQTGTYQEHYGVVEESVAWFSDAGQGGPADDVLFLAINVVPPGTTDAGTTPWDGGVDAGSDSGASPSFFDAGTGGATGAGGGNSDEQSRTLSGDSGSCAVARAPSSSTPAGLAALGLFGVGLCVRRRRRRVLRRRAPRAV